MGIQDELAAVIAERDALRERVLDLEEELRLVRDAAATKEKDLRVELEAYRQAYNRTLPPGYTRQRRKGTRD